MEKGIKVSEGGDVYYINVNVNIDKTKETSNKEGTQANAIAAKTKATIEKKDFEENEETGKTSGENFPDNTACNISLKQQFEDHKNNPNFFQMTEKTKGRVIIINNTFGSTRHGSDKDVDSLDKAFKSLKGSDSTVSIKTVSDLSSRDMLKELEFFVTSETKTSFLAVIIMSHGCQSDRIQQHGGYDDLIVCNDGERVDVKKVVKIFKKDQLKDIPVLIFFQMCRGSEKGSAGYLGVRHVDCFDGDVLSKKVSCQFRDILRDIMPGGKFIGAQYDEQGDTIDAMGDTTDEDAENHVRDTPNTLVSFSTSETFVSIRHKTNGSWFIQALCDVITEKAAESDFDILALMGEVHMRVNERRSAVYREIVVACETAESLSKKLCFFPGCP